MHYPGRRKLSRTCLQVLRLTILPAWFTNFVAAYGLAHSTAAYSSLQRWLAGLICCITVLRCETDLSHSERRSLHPTDSVTVIRTAKHSYDLIVSCICMARVLQSTPITYCFVFASVLCVT